MSDNVLQTLQRLVQDVIAPDVHELKVRLESLAKETATRFDAVDSRFKSVDSRFDTIEKQIASLSKENDAQYRGILSAIAEAKAQTELPNANAISSLRERIAVLESRHNWHNICWPQPSPLAGVNAPRVPSPPFIIEDAQAALVRGL